MTNKTIEEWLFDSKSVSALPAEDLREAIDTYFDGDTNAAFDKIMSLAKQGNFKAQFNLGAMYFAGIGIERDYEKAVCYWRFAANGGIANAQTALGSMYFAGRGGIEQDDVEAMKWFLLASGAENVIVQGNEQTTIIIASLMTREQITEAERRAEEWRKQNHKGR